MRNETNGVGVHVGIDLLFYGSVGMRLGGGW